MTSLVFKIPIKIKKSANIKAKQLEKHEIVQLFGKPRCLHKNVNDYLIKNNFDVHNFD